MTGKLDKILKGRDRQYRRGLQKKKKKIGGSAPLGQLFKETLKIYYPPNYKTNPPILGFQTMISLPTLTCSKSAMETLEKYVKYVQCKQ